MTDSPPLRLGVWCAVLRDGALLLSKRSDLNVWALPGGRLDKGESLADAAVREVAEETGMHAVNLRPVGLYFMAGWRRLNILFLADAAGGDLLKRTDETRDNRFYPLDALPNMPLAAPARDVASGRVGQMRTLQTPRLRRWQLRARFGLRYLENALRGRPEPSFPVFHVSAVALVLNADGSRLWTTPGEATVAGQVRALPRRVLTGIDAPWDALAELVTQSTGAQVALRWVGLWQDADAGALELVVAGRAETTGQGDWTPTRTVALAGRDTAYLARQAEPAPWLIDARAAADHGQALPGAGR